MALTLNTETNRKQQISHDDLTIELETLEPNLHQYNIRKNEVEELKADHQKFHKTNLVGPFWLSAGS